MRPLWLIVLAAGCVLACGETQDEANGKGDSGGESGEDTGVAGRATEDGSSTRHEAGGEAGASGMSAAAGSAETSKGGTAGASSMTPAAGGAEISDEGDAGSSGMPPGAGAAETSGGGATSAEPSFAGSAGVAGSATSFGADTCMDVLTCISGCPDTDDSCPDGCYASGSEAGQSQLLDLLTCMDGAACVDVTCIETSCDPELTVCLGDSTTASGTPNPSGDVPDGDIPSELVGHWTSPGSSDVTDFTFNADGSATYSAYKESGIGTCSMSVLSQWNTGSATVRGDLLTVTLAEGTTSVAWESSCGTSYTNPAGGKIFEFNYALDDSRSPPGLWLTDLSCTGDACQTYYRKDSG